MKVYTEFLAKLPHRTRHYVFRGQERDEWPIESGAVTRIRTQTGIEPTDRTKFDTTLKRYIQDIIFADARQRGIDLEEGRRLTHLEVLAKLQHFGAATILLDFTHDATIALWMACEDKTSDGAVFFIDMDTIGERLKRIQGNETEEDVIAMASSDNEKMIYCWEPVTKGDSSGRMIGQKSVFVVASPEALSDISTKIIINRNAKVQIRDELSSFFGIDSSSLFPDLPGYAARNGRKMPIPGFEQPAQHWHWGNRLLSENRPGEATGRYKEYLERYPLDGAVWYAMGNALTLSNQYYEAIEAYTKAVDLEGRTEAWGPSLPLADMSHVYFNRANVKAAIGDFIGAIDDYKLSAEVTDADAIRYNWGNALARLGKWRQAIEQYNTAINMGNIDAIWNKANALVHIGDFEGSINNYKAWSEINAAELEHNVNLQTANQLREFISDRDTTLEYLDENVFVYVSLPLDVPQGQVTVPLFSFTGDIGNAGNFGSFGLRDPGPGSDNTPIADIQPTAGGKGFAGYPAFFVQVRTTDPN